jgi:hypothetical protein
VRVLLLLLLLTSCGKEYRMVYPRALPEPYTYELLEEDCSTGHHESYTLEEICKTVLDDKVNNDCAREQREYLFDTSCKEIL